MLKLNLLAPYFKWRFDIINQRARAKVQLFPSHQYLASVLLTG